MSIKSAPLDPMIRKRKKVGAKNRITYERVMGWYKTANLKPHRSAVSITEDGRIGPLGAANLAKPGKKDLWSRLLISGHYGEGFMIGFSGIRLKSPAGQIQLGYMDGIEIAKRVFGYR